MIIAQIDNEISSATRMPYFGRSEGRRIPPDIKKNFFLYFWAHLHNLIKQNNNFSILKKIIEKPLLTLYDPGGGGGGL